MAHRRRRKSRRGQRRFYFIRENLLLIFFIVAILAGALKSFHFESVYLLVEPLFKLIAYLSLVAIAVMGVVWLFRVYSHYQALEQQRLEKENKREQFQINLRNAADRAVWFTMTHYEFEKFIEGLYRKLGYEAYVTPQSNDHGVDVKMKNGDITIAVQVKQYHHTVSAHEVRDFYGSYQGKFDRGIFVTTSDFSPNTRAWAEERDMELVNGHRLIALIQEADAADHSSVRDSLNKKSHISTSV